MQRKLTERFLATVKPPSTGRLEIVDEGCSGLTFRMMADGKCSWAVRYLPRGGKQRRATLGPYVQGQSHLGVTLAEAREKAASIVAAARRGVDLPALQAAEEAARLQASARPSTVQALLNTYVEDYCKTHQRRWPLTQRMFEVHVFPKMGAKPLAEVRRADVAELLDDLQNKDGLRAQVNRVRSQLVAAFNWAVEREYLDVNPAAAVKRRKIEEPRERVLSDAELKAIWRAADALPAPSGPFIKALMLTGARRDEVRCMLWSEVLSPEVAEDEGWVWLLPKDRNKGKRDHAVPLSSHVVRLLQGLPRLSDSAKSPVFTMAGEKPYAGVKRLKEILDRESGVSDWVLHDIRRTVRTRLAALGVPREVSERVLNHAADRLERTYNTHSYKAEKRQALTLWADDMMRIVGFRDGGAKVCTEATLAKAG